MSNFSGHIPFTHFISYTALFGSKCEITICLEADLQLKFAMTPQLLYLLGKMSVKVYVGLCHMNLFVAMVCVNICTYLLEFGIKN